MTEVVAQWLSGRYRTLRSMPPQLAFHQAGGGGVLLISLAPSTTCSREGIFLSSASLLVSMCLAISDQH